MQCNNHHIFHTECMKQYLAYDSAPILDKQCPLCRSQVQFQASEGQELGASTALET